MRLLLLNPNTTAAMTDRMLEVAAGAVAPTTRIEAVTAERGVPYIATRSEALIAGGMVLEMLAERHHGCDGAIIAAFGDPGLLAARELFDIPVVGMAEAAMLTACMLGGRFGIVSFSPDLEPWYRECVELYKLSDRCAKFRMLTDPFDDVVAVREDKEDLLADLCLRAVCDDGADVIVLAGAPLVGLAQRIRHRVPVPVVDQMAAAARQAETLVALSAGRTRAGSFRRPAAKSSIGLPAALADWITGADGRDLAG